MAAEQNERAKAQKPQSVFGAQASRRTMLTAAAWSTPVLAVASAVPAFAATGGVDLVFMVSSGDGFSAENSDGTRRVEQLRPVQGTLGNIGTTDIPVGTTVQVQADVRWYEGIDLHINGLLAPGTITSTSGNVRTWSYVISDPIPASDLGDNGYPTNGLSVEFVTLGSPVYVEDLAPLQVQFSPAGGNDVNPANNLLRYDAEIVELFDLEVVSAEWHDYFYNNSDGDISAARLAQTVTIRANAPGDVPAGGGVVYSVPDSSKVSVSVTATVDGAPAPGFIGRSSNDGGQYAIVFDLLEDLPAGKSAELTFTPVVSDGIEYIGVWRGAVHAQGPNFDDRDSDNDKVVAPGFDDNLSFWVGSGFGAFDTRTVALDGDRVFEARLDPNLVAVNSTEAPFTGTVTVELKYDARLLVHTLPGAAEPVNTSTSGNETRVLFRLPVDVVAGVVVGDSIESGEQDFGTILAWNPALGSPASITGGDPIDTVYTTIDPPYSSMSNPHEDPVPA